MNFTKVNKNSTAVSIFMQEKCMSAYYYHGNYIIEYMTAMRYIFPMKKFDVRTLKKDVQQALRNQVVYLRKQGR